MNESHIIFYKAVYSKMETTAADGKTYLTAFSKVAGLEKTRCENLAGIGYGF